MADFNRDRQFATGADRSSDAGKVHFERSLSPLVLQRFAEYCRDHNVPKGRREDQWQRGFPQESWVDSAWRHLKTWWALHRGYPEVDDAGKPADIEEALCGLLFNANGYLHQLLLAKLPEEARSKINEYVRNVNPTKS